MTKYDRWLEDDYDNQNDGSNPFKAPKFKETKKKNKSKKPVRIPVRQVDDREILED